jgi:ubiquinone/menaquinone biosynthesis C-methylase UbiE
VPGVPEGWEWDETLYQGSAAYYRRGRLPYPTSLRACFEAAANLAGNPRLIDVGCGPGIVAVALAPLFTDVVGVDPDPEMLIEATRLAAESGVAHARWVRLRAEELPARLGLFRYATFAQSFHWMDRDRVARIVFDMLEPGGAFVHVNTVVANPPPSPSLPFPLPPQPEIDQLVRAYLGQTRRAGQGVLAHGSPAGESQVLARAGFGPVRVVPVRGRQVFERDIEDVVAQVFALSGSAPHLFGVNLTAFEADLRQLLERASDQGRFSQWLGDIQLDFYERP